MAGHFFALKRGDEIITGIASYCRRKKISSAHFSAVGAASSAELGFYDIKQKRYHSKKFSEDLEITSLMGNVAVMQGKLVVHAHATLSGRDYKAIGGHLKTAIASGTCEVFLTELRQQLRRSYDKATGLNIIK